MYLWFSHVLRLYLWWSLLPCIYMRARWELLQATLVFVAVFVWHLSCANWLLLLLLLWEGWFPQETTMPNFYLLVVFNKFFSFPSFFFVLFFVCLFFVLLFLFVCLCLLEDNATCQLNLSSPLWLTSYISTRWECGGRGMKAYSLEWYCVWTDTLLLYSPL